MKQALRNVTVGKSNDQKKSARLRIAACACGQVEIETTGSPIVCSACHCSDCQAGSKQIESLPDAPPVLDEYGGTQLVLYRKDRIHHLKGCELHKSLKVKEGSPRRVYATCCNSFLFLDLDNPMHWVPICRGRFRNEVPPVQMRINAKFKAEGKTPPTDAPSFPSFPLRFIARLAWAKLAMVLHI